MYNNYLANNNQNVEFDIIEVCINLYNVMTYVILELELETSMTERQIRYLIFERRTAYCLGE